MDQLGSMGCDYIIGFYNELIVMDQLGSMCCDYIIGFYNELIVMDQLRSSRKYALFF
jgi:hypothetical protein